MKDEEKFEVEQKGEKVKTKFVARTPMEAQRIKLEKLMSDPNKPVLIPTVKQKKDFSNAIPSFIRNVMGSSAGAGSGEFHVYRHLRRKEYARQKHIQQKSKQETLDDEYQQKLENNRLQSEEKTAKKRAKRLKKKKNLKNKSKIPKIDQSVDESQTEESSDEEGEMVQVADEIVGSDDVKTNEINDLVSSSDGYVEKTASQIDEKATCEIDERTTCEIGDKTTCETDEKATCETDEKATCEIDEKPTCEIGEKATYELDDQINKCDSPETFKEAKETSDKMPNNDAEKEI